MEIDGETRSARKDREIIQAATAAFIGKGYDGTSMEEIATKAGASSRPSTSISPTRRPCSAKSFCQPLARSTTSSSP